MSLLRKPSAAMTRLSKSMAESGAEGAGGAYCRPVLDFIFRKHDLYVLKCAMKQSIRKAACRVFGFEVISSRIMTQNDGLSKDSDDWSIIIVKKIHREIYVDLCP